MEVFKVFFLGVLQRCGAGHRRRRRGQTGFNSASWSRIPQFQQSKSYMSVKVPQIQFTVRLRTSHRTNCAENRGDFTGAVLVVHVAVIMQRQSEVPQSSSSTELHGGLEAGQIGLFTVFSLCFYDSVHLDVASRGPGEFSGALDGEQLLVVDGSRCTI